LGFIISYRFKRGVIKFKMASICSKNVILSSAIWAKVLKFISNGTKLRINAVGAFPNGEKFLDFARDGFKPNMKDSLARFERAKGVL